MYRLIELCLEVVVKNLPAVETLEDVPDELLQKLLALCRRDKVFGPTTRNLFRNSKMTKLDFHHQEGDGPEVVEWLDITRGGIQAYLLHLDLTGVKGVTDEVVAGLHHLRKLTHLSLSACDLLTGTCLEVLQSLPLQRLLLDGCKGLNVENTLTVLSNFKSLVSLDISNCGLDDTNIRGIEKFAHLTFLDISQNPLLSGEALAPIGKLKLLRELTMAHCPNAVSGLKYLQKIPSLTNLSLSHCEVGDEDIRCLEALPQMESLILIGARITDKGVESLAKLTSLSALDLSMCTNISDKGIKSLHRLSHIKNLNLNYCMNLTDAGVATLGSLTSLGIIGCNRLLIQGIANNSRPLVLLAEDNPMQAKLIKMVFNRHNFDVELATNGQMALDMYRSNPNYEIVVMDIMMPIMDGLTSTLRIRQHERDFALKRTPIIMQTADAGKSHRQLCLEAGCDDFMTKPLDNSLIDKASKLIEASERR
jgi:CheY-like chemotaxis protein